jgi:UDP-N-acetylmuramyl pentapeptide phosphotransferase/UDP-N-acetylglucosamine-1-phosphate transferase
VKGSILLQPAGLAVVAAVFAVSIAAARRVATAFDLVARPNPIVTSHRAPVPYLGGTALIAAYLAVLVASWALAGALPARDVLARSVVALVFVVFGTLDDARPMGPWFKLLTQTLLCTGYLVAAGVPVGPGLGLKLLVLVTLVNAYNIIDVMDGLLCLLSALAVLGLLATPSLTPGHLIPELALMLVGLGVLFVFNCPPARIYAGDAGSLTLGFLVGAWGLAAAGDGGPFQSLPIVGLWAAPLIELALVIPARLRQGRSPLRGSPDHYSLRLQDQVGWSKWRVLGVTALLGGAFAAAPWVALHLPAPATAAYTIASIAAAVIAWLLLWRIPPRGAREVAPAEAPGAVRSP